MINGHGDDAYLYGDKIKYNFSSNIYGMFNHAGLKSFLSDRLGCIASYPEPAPYSLEHELSQYLEIFDKNVIVTAGATDAIYRIADCFHGCRSFIECRPTFSEYRDSCRRSCHKIVENIFDCDIIWLCNPNNPTGDVISKELLASRFKNNPEKIFIVDQSYSSYTDKPTFKASEIIRFDNLLVIDSFTKRFGVPGLRVGYVIGCDKLIGLLRRNAMPWNVSQLGIEAGKYLLTNVSSYNLPLSDLLNEANRVRQALNECGITAYDSSTPFFVCELPLRSSVQLKEFLIERFGILIRDASTFDGLTERHFRISVQSMEENNLLINAIVQWNML